jgi:hypothetical protein
MMSYGEPDFPARFNTDFTHQTQGFCSQHAVKDKKNAEIWGFFNI